MSAEVVIGALLRTYAPLTAMVGARIINGEIPQGTALPAVALEHVSTVERSTAGMTESAVLATTRIQVAVLSKSYPGKKALLSAVRAACKNKRGVIAGVTVHSILSDTVGPDIDDSSTMVFTQTIDFRVSYTAPI